MHSPPLPTAAPGPIAPDPGGACAAVPLASRAARALREPLALLLTGALAAAVPLAQAEKADRSQPLTIEADKTGSSTHIEAHLLLTFDGGRTWVDEFRLIGRHQLTGFFIRPDRGWVLTDGGVLLIGRPDPDRTSPN